MGTGFALEGSIRGQAVWSGLLSMKRMMDRNSVGRSATIDP